MPTAFDLPLTSSIAACRVPGINAVPHEDNLRYFDVAIHGPAQSPYEGMLDKAAILILR